MISNRYLVFILLVGLSISILAGQELNQLSIVGKATRATGEIVPGDKLDANKNQAALVAFITDLDVDMDFRPWNGAVGKITNPAMGRWNVYVSPGERAIDVHAEGFKPLKVVLSSFGINSVKSGEVYHLEITGNEFITISIIAEPNGAEKWLDGELLGTEDTYTVSKGEHLLEVKKSGYKEYTKTIKVEEEQVLFRDIVLNEIEPVMITLKSVPDGADFYINNVNEGKTNKQLFKFPGKYNLRLSKDKYDQIEETISVTEIGNNVFEYYLKKNTSLLSISTTPSDCNIYINNEELSGNSKEVSAGKYKIEVKKEGYFPESRTVTVSNGIDKSDSFSLQPKTGKLQFEVEPIGAQIIMKQDKSTVQSWNGSRYLNKLSVGDYTIHSKAPGFLSDTKNFKVNFDQLTEINVKLTRNDTIVYQMVELYEKKVYFEICTPVVSIEYPSTLENDRFPKWVIKELFKSLYSYCILYEYLDTLNTDNFYSIDSLMHQYIDDVAKEYDKQIGNEIDFNSLDEFSVYCYNYSTDTIINVENNSILILSLSYYNYTYTGGAHGYYYKKFINYDKINNKEIILDDIFINNWEMDLTRIAEYKFRKTHEIPINGNINDYGYWFDNDKFQLNNNFLLGKSGITFLYNPYDICCFAMGIQSVYIPYSDIIQLVKSNSILHTYLESICE